MKRLLLFGTILAIGMTAKDHAGATTLPRTKTLPDAATAACTSPRTHVARKGDSFWKMAKRYYGTGASYLRIAEANHRNPADVIFPGETFLVPCPESRTADRQESPAAATKIVARATATALSEAHGLPKQADPVRNDLRKHKPYSTRLDHNPLNITYGRLTAHWVNQGIATIKWHQGLPYLAFPDASSGIQAAEELLFGTFYAEKTVGEVLRSWSGGHYGPEILRGAAISPRALLKSLQTAERSTLFARIAKIESGIAVELPVH